MKTRTVVSSFLFLDEPVRAKRCKMWYDRINAKGSVVAFVDIKIILNETYVVPEIDN